jgi:hypothetical protein
MLADQAGKEPWSENLDLDPTPLPKMSGDVTEWAAKEQMPNILFSILHTDVYTINSPRRYLIMTIILIRFVLRFDEELWD